VTPETDILIPAVLPLKDRCSLNFHFCSLGPWDPCYFHLRESVFFSPCSTPSLSTACRERASEKETQDCSYSLNQSSDCTSSLVTFRVLAGVQPLPPPSCIKFHYITLICSKEKKFAEIYTQPVLKGQTPFYTEPVMHTNQCLLRKPNWKCLPYYYLHAGH
jgi:hypothetical protein